MDAVCDVAHLRYDHKLHAAATARAATVLAGPQRQSHRTRATAYAPMSLAHEWRARVASWPALRGATLQDVQAGTLNKRLRDEVLEVVSKNAASQQRLPRLQRRCLHGGARAQT